MGNTTRPYVVLLGGTVQTGVLTADNGTADSEEVVIIDMTHAPHTDLGIQHRMYVAVLPEDARTLADSLLRAADSLPREDASGHD